MGTMASVRKITKVVDELTFYLLRAGSKNVHTDIQRIEGKYIVVIDSEYDDGSLQEMKILSRMLLEAKRDRSIEEEYWELMGMNGAKYDSELQLVGMLIDHSNVILNNGKVHIELERFL